MVSVVLTDSELLLLDGRVSEKAQAEIDIVKRRQKAAERLSSLPALQAAFVSDLVAMAIERGELIFRPERMRTCRACGKSGGYATYPRNGRRHRKGDKNYDKPLYVGGWEFTNDFVRMVGYPTLACCNECWRAVKDIAVAELANIDAVLPEKLTGVPPRFKRFTNKVCLECGWEGHEGEMGRRPTIMGDGTYAASCPKCNAANLLFGPLQVKNRDGFVLIPRDSQ